MNTLTLSPFRKLHPESVNRPGRTPRRFFHVGLMILITALPAFSSGTPAKDPTGAKSDAQRAMNSMDRRFFIENKGQWHSDVLFLARMGGLDAWITKYGVNYTFYKTERKETPGDKAPKDRPRGKFDHEDMENSKLLGHRVLFELEGHNPGPAREGLQKQEGYYNYLIGNDPSKHASYVGLYKEALVKDVYPGIDIRYYFDRGFLRYDFVVHPGADPAQIRFSLKGQDADEIKDNKLVYTTRFGEVQMADLHSYQEGGREVRSRFVRSGDAWQIEVGAYEKNRTLVIDPLVYSTFIGGSADGFGLDIAVDASGQTYVTGRTNSIDYDVTPGAFQTSHGGTWDVFVTKLNATGTGLIYSTYIGGSNLDVAYGIAVDGSGAAYVTGYTNSTDYDVTPGAFQATLEGYKEVFVTKLCTTGSATLTLTSAPSTVAQTVCVGTAVVPVTYAAAHVISISASGLPPGISLSFSDDTVTLAGVPDAPGTYNYTITGTGVCDTVTVTGSFTVNPLPAFTLTSAPGTESQTVCIGTAISAIQYTTTNIATVSFSGLPPGVSSLFSGTTISIYGTPSATGSYSYIITGTGSCGSQMTAGSITVLPPPTWYEDADVDGFGNAAVSMMACTAPLGYVANNTDCDDNDANNYPGNAEVWDCQDNDCDGLVDEGTGALALTQLNPESCGVTVLNYSHVLRANAMAGAVQYEFEFSDGINTYYELRPNRGFYFLLFTWPMYNTTYTVRVRWYDGSNWSCWGPPCTVTTPAHPTTHLDDASCDAMASSPTHVFRAIHIPGAVQYEFAFDVGASTYYEVRPNRGFYFSLFSWDTYNTTYTVKVRWFDGAAWSDWGPPCTVTTSAMPATQLQAGDCGASAVNSTQIFQAINMPEATQYEFEFSDGVNTYYELRPNRAFYFALWNWYVPLTTYNVRVRWYDDFVWSDWGPICTLTSPSLGTTKLNMASCDAVATSPAQVFRANTIPGALNYEFEFYDGTNTYYEVRPNNVFYFALFSWPVFGTTYTVRVRWFNGTTWSPWGATCTLTYPMPTTQLQASDCGALVTSPAQVLRADNMVVASQYEFRVSDGSNVWTLVRPNRGFYLSLFGLPPGTFTIGTYTVDVRWYHSASSTWSDWGSPCDIYILDDMSHVTENIENTSFNIHAFPVPFEHTVNLTVETFSPEPVHIIVTDVNGRVVEERRRQMEHNGLLTLGENWSNGVYMIRVQQGTRKETLKVIKSHNR